MFTKKRETLPTNNLFAIIILIFIITTTLSSFLTYTKARMITQELTGGVPTEAQARFCINKQPTATQGCNTTATVGVGYYCDASGSDPDNDTLTFYDDSPLFSIDPTTGEIIFTPTAGDAGAHSITITASDGKGCTNSNATTTFTLTIPSVPGGAGGGGGGGGGAAIRECSPQWECTPWSSCASDQTQTRQCYTLNNCLKDKPAETASCTYLLPPRPRTPSMQKFEQFYLCNFDEESECFANFGPREDWVYTYQGRNSTINIMSIESKGAGVAIDDDIYLFAPLQRIQPVDVTADGVYDFEYILHKIAGGRADMTVRLMKQVKVVVEKPIYIAMVPIWIRAMLVYIYENPCVIALILILLTLIIICVIVSRDDQKKRR
jgi:hypothetical protein